MRKLSIITLGVADINSSALFYESVLELKRTDYDSNSIVFFDLDGPELALFSREELAKDVGVLPDSSGFPGITLAHNVSSSKEVIELLEKASENGGKVVKEAQPVFWGGFSGYFSDPDGYLWEIACGSEDYANEKRNTKSDQMN